MVMYVYQENLLLCMNPTVSYTCQVITRFPVFVKCDKREFDESWFRSTMVSISWCLSLHNSWYVRLYGSETTRVFKIRPTCST